MLKINNLCINVEKVEQPIIHDLNINIAAQSVSALMGPNGSGKSTLAYAIMGHPGYKVTAGSIFLDGVDISAMPTYERARRGIFLSFQQPVAIPGVTVFTFLYESYRAVRDKDCSIKKFECLLQELLCSLSTDNSFIRRSMNEQFSGGEKKKFELLQLCLLEPKVAILDEIDSGLDIDALQQVASGINAARFKNPSMSIFIITHYARILNYIEPDTVHILAKGKIVRSGSKQLVDIVERDGYKQMIATV